ncbi:Inner membrane protein CreD-like protein [hydrothermal vent metagenome]|uniref:Inner membrane protein CreD-like protein n=1 Tax=hydrothermal vent metagenome TaxID=652676 RepID=A0A3B0RFA6_9ZZZZ
MTKSTTQWKPQSSPGLKLLLVCALALVMTIPALFVFVISYDRSSRADNTKRQIAQAAGGAQKLVGPVLAIPIEVKDDSGVWNISDTLLVFADSGTAQADLSVTTKKKSLYAVQVYESDLVFDADFDLGFVSKFSDAGQKLRVEQAQILIGVSDLRGALDDAWLSIANKQKRKFTPFSGDIFLQNQALSTGTFRLQENARYNWQGTSMGQVLTVPVGEDMQNDSLQVHVAMTLGGAQDFTLVPFARSSKLTLKANWPHPGFGGQYLPTSKDITDAGFTASRTVPALASGLPPLALSSQFENRQRFQTGMRVTLVEASSPYQFVTRALKYALMFIGFVFLAYFLFEMNTTRPVHAAQYVLVGLAQTVFYLLLLALSEHLGFDLAFLIAAGLIVGLTGLYAGAVFGRAKMLPALMVFGFVYGLMFILMRLEDFALVVGAFASFFAIATTMWMTRKMKWYADKPPECG